MPPVRRGPPPPNMQQAPRRGRASKKVARKRSGGSEPDDAWHVECSRPKPPLLASSQQERIELLADGRTHVQSSDSLGPVHLMSGESEQVDTKRVDVERQPSGGLRCVAMKDDSTIAGQRGKLPYWMDGADFIVC